MTLATLLGIDTSLVDLWGQLDADTQAATALVVIVTAGADGGLRRKYALKWWSEFLPERVALAALTSATLAEFSAELARRLDGQIGAWKDGEAHRALWQELIALPVERQRRVLDVLESQATVCTTLVRADLDAKRLRETEHGETKSESGDSSGITPLFDRWSGDGPGASSDATEPVPADAGAPADS